MVEAGLADVVRRADFQFCRTVVRKVDRKRRQSHHAQVQQNEHGERVKRSLGNVVVDCVALKERVNDLPQTADQPEYHQLQKQPPVRLEEREQARNAEPLQMRLLFGFLFAHCRSPPF